MIIQDNPTREFEIPEWVVRVATARPARPVEPIPHLWQFGCDAIVKAEVEKATGLKATQELTAVRS